ncbi:DUF3667 domain-containing protein [Novosphingobium sp.]|uniref:DUF3667 domain-containing protein n=1 Tax=Novosphingobium sp. TaxID=1874826 RepID=UPI0038B87371
MSNADALGDAVTTVMTANAVEPSAGRSHAADDGHTHETACLNCGTALIGAHCHACGQHAHVHRTLGAFFHDLLHGVFHFEGKIWTTLPMLALRPGTLTRNYIDGQRARYVSPLALFLFCVFLLFFVIQQTTGEMHIGGEQKTAVQASVAGQATQGLTAAQQELVTKRAERAKLAAAGEDTDDADEEIANIEHAVSLMRAAKAAGSGEKLPSTGFAMLDDAIEHVSKNPELAVYKLQSHAYKYSWALIPISVPFLWLLFPFGRRRFPLYDHTVFVTYSISFMTLLTIVVMLGQSVGLTGLVLLYGIIPPLHMYRQLRGAYNCSRAGALVRTGALLVIAFVALTIFVSLIAAETAG